METGLPVRPVLEVSRRSRCPEPQSLGWESVEFPLTLHHLRVLLRDQQHYELKMVMERLICVFSKYVDIKEAIWTYQFF